MTKPCEVSVDETSKKLRRPFHAPHFQGSDTPRVTRRARDIRIPESATPRPRGRQEAERSLRAWS